MEVLVEMNAGTSSSLLSPPPQPLEDATGPGGLRNMSALSRKAATTRKKEPPPEKKKELPPVVKKKIVPEVSKKKIVEEELSSAAASSRREKTAPVEPPPPPPVVIRRSSRDGRRTFGLATLAAHVYACRMLGGASAVVAACGGVALLVALRAHDDDETLARYRAVAALRAPVEKLETLRRVALERCPIAVKKLAVAVGIWRLAGLLFSPQKVAAAFRCSLVAILALASCFAYLPLVDKSRRASTLGKVVGFAFVAWTGLVAVDAALGPDASATLACAAWLARPSVDTLELKRRKRSDVLPLRSRDLGVLLVVADRGPSDRYATLYVGFFGAWFVANRPSSPGNPPPLEPTFERLE